MAEQKKNTQKRAAAAKSGSAKKSTAAKPAAKTKQTKSGTARSVPEQTSLPIRKRRDENSFLHRMLPYVFVVCAVLIGVCFIFHDGSVGRAIFDLFFGTFGLVAVLIPFVLFLFAWKWRGWVADGMQTFESVFGLLFEIFAGALAQIILIAGSGEEFNTIAAKTLWTSGTKLVGGGFLGGFFGSLLYRGFAATAGIIFTVVLLLLLTFALFGITPRSIWINIRYQMQMNRERREAAALRKREEREFDYETVAAPEVPVRPAKSAFEKRTPKRITESALSNPDFDMNVDDSLTAPQTERNAEKTAEPAAEDAEAPEKGAMPIADLWSELSVPAPENEPASEIVFENVPDFEIVPEKEPEPQPKEKPSVYNQYGEIDLGAIFTDDPAQNAPAAEEEPELGGEDIGSLAAEYAEASFADERTDADADADVLTVTTSDAGIPAPSVDQTPVLQKPEYRYPPITLLAAPENKKNEDVGAELRANAQKLIETLHSFRVNASLMSVSRGPTITRYELVPEAGTRVRSIANLVDDISLALASPGIRIEAPIPGKAAVGIEVPNKITTTVTLRELIEDKAFTEAKSKLAVCLGKDVGGTPIIFDIAKMPHLLIAGATGMGKSVCINSLITSILYKATPDEVKLVLIDPKKVEFNIYNGIPHLQIPVVSEPKKAAGALHWAVTEMERRYELIEEVGARKIETYNEIAKSRGLEVLPYVVIIIDELADLMMTAPDAVEDSVCRLAQKARAAGMHIIIGTQRPSVDVITGLIKANIPSRIAFTVASQVDSRTIIDIAGAEKLIGRGDMLYYPVGLSKPMRAQGAFVSEDEVERITDFVKQNAGENEYDEDIMQSIEREAQAIGQQPGKKGAADPMADDGAGDPKLRDALELATDVGKISTSLLQRKLSIGYGRAAKIIDIMETRGFVSAPDGQKPREVLVTKTQFREMVVNNDERLN